MASRREVLEMTLAATTLPLTASALVAPMNRSDDELVLPYKVLYDVRFAAARAFADRIAARGSAAQPFAGDITRFWYDDLYHRWRDGPATIAGLTGYGALFCLEQLAAAQRLRVLFRSEHTALSAGGVKHSLEGPAALVAQAEHSLADGDWVVAVADMLLQCPRRVGARITAGVTSASREEVPADESLYAWVIGPIEMG